MDPTSDPNTLTFAGSSNVRSAQFDPNTGKVLVEFKNGSKYTYGNFTSALVDEWRAAQSPGGWFNSTVKSSPDKYPQIGTGSTPTSSDSSTPFSDGASASLAVGSG